MLILLAGVAFAIYWFMQQNQFGSVPTGDRLKKIQQSPHYKNGRFQNLNPTPQLTEGANLFSVLVKFIFKSNRGKRPGQPIPSIKTDLHQIPVEQNILVWFGHSSYFMQLDEKKFLVDPVLSGSASPLPGGTKAFAGADIYRPEDIPDIHFLMITHDHWDHLDYQSIIALRHKIGTIICPLGVGAHFEKWGFPTSKLIEKDWFDSFTIATNFTVTLEPARHFAGRTLHRNTSLWTSFVLQTPSFKIFIGGDSGYDTHFAEIGNKHGGFDLAILENGQYDKQWRYIHLLPDEILKAAEELHADKLLPVHSSKFSLGNHDWDEPLRLLTKNAEGKNIKIITPMIGEMVEIDNNSQHFSKWWIGL